MTGRLDGKVAIVTGGATGIGEAICHKFADEGAKVVCVGLETDPVDDVVNGITERGFPIVGFKGDVSSETTAEQAVRFAVSTFGKLDVLVNNAGVFLAVAETDKFPIDAFDATLRNNLRSTFLMTRFALPELKKTKGNIVSAGSEAGFNGEAMNTPYGGTKGFMHSFMMGVAVEQGKYGIRANCVCPGPIDTSWTHKNTGPMTGKLEKNTVDATVLGRRGTPMEMANVYAFLASDEASYVTGALFLADGGTTPAKGAVGAEAQRDVRQEPDNNFEEELEHQYDGEKNKAYQTIQ